MVAKTSNESIISLLSEMRPLLIIAGIPENQIRVRAGKHRIETMSKAFDWLHNLKISDQYINMINIWTLLPRKTWEHYKLFEIVGLREQKLLETAGKHLFKKWKAKRPPMFNKDRKRKKPNE